MLGQAIRDLRKARGWTQAELARRAGVTQQAISYAERTGDAGREVLVGCARAFGIAVETLLDQPPPDELGALLTEIEAGGAPAILVASYRKMADKLVEPEDRAAVLVALRALRDGQRQQKKPRRRANPPADNAAPEPGEGRIMARGMRRANM